MFGITENMVIKLLAYVAVVHILTTQPQQILSLVSARQDQQMQVVMIL